MIELIERTKKAVHEVDKANYKLMKMMMNEVDGQHEEVPPGINNGHVVDGGMTLEKASVLLS